MPRKQSDKIITHRIEFSPKERELVNDIINTQKENQRLDAVTSTLNAAGVAIGGSGALIAALGLAAWFGFNVKDKAKEVFNEISDAFADASSIIITGNTVEENVENLMDSIGIGVDERTRLKNRMHELREEENRYCNSNSQYYDTTECARVKAEQQQVKAEYEALIDRAKREMAGEEGTFVGSLKMLEDYFNPFS